MIHIKIYVLSQPGEAYDRNPIGLSGGKRGKGEAWWVEVEDWRCGGKGGGRGACMPLN